MPLHPCIRYFAPNSNRKKVSTSDRRWLCLWINKQTPTCCYFPGTDNEPIFEDSDTVPYDDPLVDLAVYAEPATTEEPELSSGGEPEGRLILESGSPIYLQRTPRLMYDPARDEPAAADYPIDGDDDTAAGGRYMTIASFAGTQYLNADDVGQEDDGSNDFFIMSARETRAESGESSIAITAVTDAEREQIVESSFDFTYDPDIADDQDIEFLDESEYQEVSQDPVDDSAPFLPPNTIDPPKPTTPKPSSPSPSMDNVASLENPAFVENEVFQDGSAAGSPSPALEDGSAAGSSSPAPEDGSAAGSPSPAPEDGSAAGSSSPAPTPTPSPVSGNSGSSGRGSSSTIVIPNNAVTDPRTSMPVTPKPSPAIPAAQDSLASRSTGSGGSSSSQGANTAATNPPTKQGSSGNTPSSSKGPAPKNPAETPVKMIPVSTDASAFIPTAGDGRLIGATTGAAGGTAAPGQQQQVDQHADHDHSEMTSVTIQPRGRLAAKQGTDADASEGSSSSSSSKGGVSAGGAVGIAIGCFAAVMIAAGAFVIWKKRQAAAKAKAAAARPSANGEVETPKDVEKANAMKPSFRASRPAS